MADVFISYHEDSAGELAQQIADALDAAGISAWCARRDMPPGDDFARHIPQQIQNCRLFLWILTDGAYHSRNVENEVGLASRRLNQRGDILIFPIRTADFTWKEGEWITYYLIQIQSVEFPEKVDASHIRELIWKIANVLQVQPQLSATVIKSGSCGDNVAYTLDDSGLLTISGAGPMRDYKWNREKQHTNTPWSEESETIFTVRIESGVSAIGKRAFAECEKLMDIFIPNSVTSIGDYAFWCCDHLTNIEIPNSVTFIGNYAFEDCWRLASIEIPDSVISIGKCAFAGCHRVRSVYIPDSVISVGEFAFVCKGMESASIPANANISDHAFLFDVMVTRRA